MKRKCEICRKYRNVRDMTDIEGSMVCKNNCGKKYRIGNKTFSGNEKLKDVAEQLSKKEEFEELKRETWRERPESKGKTAQEIIDEVENE